MMAAIRRFLRTEVIPITHNNVRPAARDPDREKEIRSARADLVGATMRLERKSWEVRQELAGNVLNIVSGDR